LQNVAKVERARAIQFHCKKQGLMHTVAARPGLIIVDATLNLMASNAEALNILAFPRTGLEIAESKSIVAERLRSQISHPHTYNGSPAVLQLRSGMRTYICHAFPVDLLSNTCKQAYVLMLERETHPALTLEEICARYNLTPREQQVVSYLVRGLTSKEIADQMQISAHTVKAFLRLVMVKLNVSTRSGVIGKIVGGTGT
jgi:DNA-binding NarL/FixJ family response regulator